MALDSYVKVVKAQKSAQKPTYGGASSEVYTPKVEPKILSPEQTNPVNIMAKDGSEAWKSCEYLKVKDNELYCSYFVAKCGMERCNKRFLSTTKKIPKL
ncbi:MAG: hypothetical protein QXM75_00580 [Candidatus Diapherotrites archaeon]